MDDGRQPGDRLEKLVGLAALSVSIELILFKFLPDVSTAVIQHDTSALTDFTAYERGYIVPGSVHHARFLGNYLLYFLAKAIGSVFYSGDIRLHPLRIAAAILTPVYAVAGAYLPIRSGSGFSWREFLTAYSLMVLIGLYVFYPADMPSLACLSVAIFFLLQRKLGAALLATMLLGLYRETSFHMVWLVAVWAWCDTSSSQRERIAWPGIFALAFAIEYIVVRRFFPGPVSSAAGGFILDPRVLFLEKGTLSLTSLCSLGLAVLFPVACLGAMRGLDRTDWKRRFFVINCYVFPGWLVFYRMMNGNLSEFRMLFPVLIVCIYGIAYGHRQKRAAELSEA